MWKEEFIKLNEDYLFKRTPNYAIMLTKERRSVLKRTRKNKDSIIGGERGGWKSPRPRERDGAFRFYLAGTTEHELITHKYTAATTPPAHNYTFNMISLSRLLDPLL